MGLMLSVVSGQVKKGLISLIEMRRIGQRNGDEAENCRQRRRFPRPHPSACVL